MWVFFLFHFRFEFFSCFQMFIRIPGCVRCSSVAVAFFSFSGGCPSALVVGVSDGRHQCQSGNLLRYPWYASSSVLFLHCWSSRVLIAGPVRCFVLSMVGFLVGPVYLFSHLSTPSLRVMAYHLTSLRAVVDLCVSKVSWVKCFFLFLCESANNCVCVLRWHCGLFPNFTSSCHPR